MNENTNDDVNFFAVKLELWQVGGSMPAPKFDIICRPNEWAKTVKKQEGQSEPSEGKLAQLDFWTRLREYAKQNKSEVRLQAPSPQHWTNVSIGSARAHVTVSMHMRDQHLRCELYIPNDKALFESLKVQQNDIERELGSKLEFIEASKATRIVETLEGFDILDKANADKSFDWLLERAAAFKSAFLPRIKNFESQE
jgi:hypothetical protein